MQSKNNRTLGGILLVAGTCIGAGMIGVPVKTAAAGFYPTVAAFILLWVVTVITSFLFLEISLAFKGEINIISMVKDILGDLHKKVAWIVYLLFMYFMMSAYTSGSVTLMMQVIPMSFNLWMIIFLLPFIAIVYLGPKIIDLINRLLTFGLIISFILLCCTALFNNSSHHMKSFSNFSFIGDLKVLLFALPIIATTFCYQVIIPSLKTYLKSEIFSLKKTILIGTIIPLIIYLTWETVILMLIPIFGEDGLISMLHVNKNPGDSIVNYLMLHGHSKIILTFITTFLFCALTTSLLGVAWALFDFLADGFNLDKNIKKNKVLLTALAFLPPATYSWLWPDGFLRAVGVASIFSTILTIIYPALMVLYFRNKKSISNSSSLIHSIKYKAPINNKLILITLLFGWVITILQCINMLS